MFQLSIGHKVHIIFVLLVNVMRTRSFDLDKAL
jgi:hypothetical protein